MEHLWDNLDTYTWGDYVRGSREFAESMTASTVLFGLLFLFSFPAWIFLSSTLTDMGIFTAYSITCTFLYVYRMYRIEKRYRAISASFPFYARRSPMTYVALTFAILFIPFSWTPILGSLPANLGMIIVFGAMGISSLGVFLYSPAGPFHDKAHEPLQNEDVTSRVAEMASRLGIGGVPVWVRPGNMMRVANARCHGFTRFRITVTDYLLDNLSEEEVIAVMAHELGHAASHHSLKIIVPMIIIASAFLALYTGVIMFMILPQYFVLVIFFPLVFPILSLTSRGKAQKTADRYAADLVGTDPMISALRKISYLNFTPETMGGFGSVKNRIAALGRYGNRKNARMP